MLVVVWLGAELGDEAALQLRCLRLPGAGALVLHGAQAGQLSITVRACLRLWGHVWVRCDLTATIV